jgi:putative aldouronate transport system permease protein
VVKSGLVYGNGFNKEKVYDIINNFIIVILCFVFIFPFLNVFAKSVSGEAAVLSGSVKLVPIDFHLNAYKYVLSRSSFYNSLKNSIIVTILGTLFSMVIICLTAYPLSRKSFKGRKFITRMFIFIMVFNAGVIPGFLVVKNLGLLDTIWALVIPASINPFYVMILKSFMTGIPDSIEESAKLDGASHFQILLKIIIPLSIPALASLLLFYAVDYWNDFFRPLIFIQSDRKYTLQLYLRMILIDVGDIQATLDPVAFADTAPQTIQNATVIVSTIPILIVYPFLQRYFVKGITLGAIKG